MLNIPLMDNNITREDVDILCDFLQHTDRFTQGNEVKNFETEWSQWLGVKYSVFVNSGASANLLTILACRELYPIEEVCVPALTWSSDVASIFHCGLKPCFIDIDLATLAMDEEALLRALDSRGEEKIVFLSHILGLNGLTQRMLDAIEASGALLIEDVCESHGATFRGGKLGTYGKASNFSYYYAHHMSTIEGGMICTDDEEFYETCRMLRSHGMLRECTSDAIVQRFYNRYPSVNKEFFFAYPGLNVRSTELHAVIGRNQLKRLDENNQRRRNNYAMFLEGLDPKRFFTDYRIEGNCNYALTTLLKEPDRELFSSICKALREKGVEFRRGMSGGGNMLRQPFIIERIGWRAEDFPNADKVHHFGFYSGNYPSLEAEKIRGLCSILNHT